MNFITVKSPDSRTNALIEVVLNTDRIAAVTSHIPWVAYRHHLGHTASGWLGQEEKGSVVATMDCAYVVFDRPLALVASDPDHLSHGMAVWASLGDGGDMGVESHQILLDALMSAASEPPMKWWR